MQLCPRRHMPVCVHAAAVLLHPTIIVCSCRARLCTIILLAQAHNASVVLGLLLLFCLSAELWENSDVRYWCLC